MAIQLNRFLTLFLCFLWPPNRAAISAAAVSSFFSSPIVSGRRLDVYHTSTHEVALVRI